MKYLLLINYEEMEIPYEEDTRSWHVWLDLAALPELSKGVSFTTKQLAELNGMPEEYYNGSFDELLADYYVTVIEEGA